MQNLSLKWKSWCYGHQILISFRIIYIILSFSCFIKEMKRKIKNYWKQFQYSLLKSWIINEWKSSQSILNLTSGTKYLKKWLVLFLFWLTCPSKLIYVKVCNSYFCLTWSLYIKSELLIILSFFLIIIFLKICVLKSIGLHIRNIKWHR